MTIHVVPINDIQLAYECFGSEADDTILLIAGLGTQTIHSSYQSADKIPLYLFRTPSGC